MSKPPLPPGIRRERGDKRYRWLWAYRTVDGTVDGYCVRYDAAPVDEEKPAKDVIPHFCFGGEKWRGGLRDNIHPIFGMESLALLGPVLIHEGEKSAAAVHGLGTPALTWCGGAGSVALADWPTVLPLLAGREIFLLPDNDDEGLASMERLAQLLLALDPSLDIKICRLPGLPSKGDVVDWIQAYWSDWDGFTSLAGQEGISDLADELRQAIMDNAAPVARSNTSEWPEPLPLPSILEVELFTSDLLPEALRPWICDIAERVQVPMDYPAVAAVVALGSVIGRQVTIRPRQHDSWFEVPNLWGCIVGPPGTLKSPSIAAAMAPLHRLAQQASRDFEAARAADRVNQIMHTAEKKDLQEKINSAFKGKAKQNIASAEDMARQLAALEERSIELLCRRFLTSDSTIEKLGELLKQNPNGLLYFRDELAGFLRSLEKQGRESDRAFYLEAWKGHGAFTQDRISRGTVSIEGLCISVFGTIQPGPLAQYMRENAAGAGADGFISRFQLMVYPDVSATWTNVDRAPDEAAASLVMQAFEHCASLDLVRLGAEVEPGALPYLRFDTAARIEFEAWREVLETSLRGNRLTPAIKEHLAKYRGLVPSLALIFHLANGRTGPVTTEALRMAIRWASYLESHAARIYGAAGDLEAARKLLAKIKVDAHLESPCTARMLHHKGWSGLTEIEVVERALAFLEKYGYVRSVERRGKGRPTADWYLHPDLLKG
jgi:hypothetical protein